jgi:hypothetical protein
MSFDTRAGTRGARQPKGRALRWLNTLMARRIRRRSGGKFMGFDALVLRTIGRKSGEERLTPVGWFPVDDGSRLIVASAAGAPGNPAWYYTWRRTPIGSGSTSTARRSKSAPYSCTVPSGRRPGIRSRPLPRDSRSTK